MKIRLNNVLKYVLWLIFSGGGSLFFVCLLAMFSIYYYVRLYVCIGNWELERKNVYGKLLNIYIAKKK